MTDTHTHLYLDAFDIDRHAVIQRAQDAGVKYFYLPNIDTSSIIPVLKLADKYPGICLPMMGLHPCSVKENYEQELETICSWFEKQRFYGIGETGIDLYRDQTFLEQQKKSFAFQAELAKKLNLPLVIHNRNAFDEIIAILEAINHESLTGVFHCFTGNIEQANRIIKLGGFMLGIGGVVTFKNNQLQNVLPTIPPEYIVLETDAPYLAPEPFRGRRNESAYLAYVLQKLSEIYGISTKDLEKLTDENAARLFKY